MRRNPSIPATSSVKLRISMIGKPIPGVVHIRPGIRSLSKTAICHMVENALVWIVFTASKYEMLHYGVKE